MKPGEQITFLEAALGDNRAQAKALHQQVQYNAALRPLASNPLLLSLIAEEPNQLQLPATPAAFYCQAVHKIWYDKLSGLGEAAQGSRLDGRARPGPHRPSAADGPGSQKSGGGLATGDPGYRKVAGKRDNLLQQALERAGLLRVNWRQATFSFMHLTFQEFYLARALKPAGLKQALQQHWHDPRYEETLGLLISMLFEEERLDEIENNICWLIGWGEEVHRKDPGKMLHGCPPMMLGADRLGPR